LTFSGLEPTDALVAMSGVTLGYGGSAVLSDLSFRIHKGDLLGLVGPNGSGKTTILRAILGLLGPMAGTVRSDPDVRFGYVPQRKSLNDDWPLNALDVVVMGLYDRVGWLRRPTRAHERVALDALDYMGLAALGKHRFSALSGGQKQRVLIARALVGRPSMLLLDEPTSGMDIAGTAAILAVLRRLHERDGLTIVMVSHQINEVARVARRLGLVTGGGLRIGATEEMLTETNLSALYGTPVRVARTDGHRIVFAHDPDDDDSSPPVRV
jgi:manganese/zinc/iron transport system ATP- binding protein